MITEILTWLQQQSVNVVAGQSVNDVLLITYCLLFLNTKKAGLPLAFLFSYVIFNLSILDSISNENFYLLQSAFDCLVISVIFRANNKKTISLYLIMIILNLVMFSDELNKLGETFTYNNYASIVLLIHVLIILSAINYRRLIMLKSIITDFIFNIVYNKNNTINFKTDFHNTKRIRQ